MFKYPKTVELATKHLIELVGVALELKELDPINGEWYEGFRDAVVVLIGDATGADVNIVREELVYKVREFVMENRIEEEFPEG